ncbi:MAG: PQQ-dependent sugar dehydrogenase [Bacteriovoracaceae bacterium]|nr:PQQ-dependent sugar dehydrogenase [Bacteriovoracaceae bacterium]
MKISHLLFLIFFLLLNDIFGKDLLNKDVVLKEVVTFDDQVIWGFAFVNDKELLLTLREGKFYHLNLITKKKTLLDSPKVEAFGQGGLLDVQVFMISGRPTVFLTFSSKENGTVTSSLAKGYFKNGKLSELKTIFSAKVKSDTTRHFGSRLAYDGEFIYMTVGDRGERKFAQDLRLHNGKILRLTVDGKPAPNNPFISSGNLEVWSYGHRNPQGIVFDKKRGLLFSCEFGPRGGDELNLIKRGLNYGWPIITYGREYYGPSIGTTHQDGMEQPLIHWEPSISPSGLTVYYGDKFPEWRGSLLLANLSSNHIRRLEYADGKIKVEQKILEDLKERIRYISEGPDGFIYFSTDSGKIMRIESLN